MTLNFVTKIKGNGDTRQLQDDIDKMIKWSKNGRYPSILSFLNAYAHGTETLWCTMKWEVLFNVETVKEKGYEGKKNANMEVSEQCIIATSGGNRFLE